jgi:hypothetical protein
MNLLDENIIPDQREKLRRYKIRCKHIGYDILEKGFDDTEEIIPFLLSRKEITLFTNDGDFEARRLRHANYCLVILKVSPTHYADSIRRFLKDKNFNTIKKRMGKIIRVGEHETTVLAS